MKKSVLILLLLAIFSSQPLFADRYTDMAQQMLEWMKQGQADSILAHSTPQVKAAMPATTLQGLWNTVAQQMGELKTQKPWKQTTMQGFQILQSILVFERSSICIQVVLDENLLLAGLRYVPAPAEETAPQEEKTEQETTLANNDAFSEREIVIANGKVSLPGTLTLPRKTTGKVPAVVLVHGSGPNDRDETMGPNKPFRDLAHALAAKGIAVVRYDKRTKVYGQKTAEVSDGKLTLDAEYVDDAVQALRQMAAIEEVDSNRLFVLGHSQGGTLAPRIAIKSFVPVKGIIGMAALARPFWETVNEQLHYILKTSGMTDEKAEKEIKKQLTQMKNALPKEYLASLEEYDPLLAADELGEMPVLFLQGGHDYQVTEADLNLWKSALAENPKAQFQFFPELDHLMRPLQQMAVPADYMAEGKMSNEVIEAIAKFITTQAQ